MKPLHYLKSSNRMLLSSLCLMLSIASHSAHSTTEAKLKEIKDYAQSNRLVPFQGQLADAQGNPINGQVRLTFKLYTQTIGGTPQWVEVHQSISVINGFVNALLGAETQFNNPPSPINFSQPLYLGITVGSDTSSELYPRHQLFPSFHARTAEYAETASTSLRSLTAANADNSTKLGEQPIGYFVSTPTLKHTVGSLNQTIQDAVSTAIANIQLGLTPVGAIIAWPASTPPNGWLELNRQQVKKSDYPELWAFAESSGFSLSANKGRFYKNNDDYMSLPDLRGEFIRGWDHGRGIDSGRVFGSTQTDSFRSHSHKIGSLYTVGVSSKYTRPLWHGAGTTHGQNTGGSETRPRNIAYMYIIYTGSNTK
jgi:hypothetical protein